MHFDLEEGSTSSGAGGHILLLENQGEVHFDLEEGSSSSEILWLDEDAFDLKGSTTKRNIVGVAHFCACANPYFCQKYSH